MSYYSSPWHYYFCVCVCVCVCACVQVGGSGSLFGLFGVLLVELLQGWRWVKKPWAELIKLCIFIIVMLGEN